jgi:hypothetical protein
VGLGLVRGVREILPRQERRCGAMFRQAASMGLAPCKATIIATFSSGSNLRLTSQERSEKIATRWSCDTGEWAFKGGLHLGR